MVTKKKTTPKKVVSKSVEKRIKIQKEEVIEKPKVKELPIVDNLKVVEILKEEATSFHCSMEDGSTRFVDKSLF